MTTEQNPSTGFEPQGPMSAASSGAASQSANSQGPTSSGGQNGGPGQGHRRRRRRRSKGSQGKPQQNAGAIQAQSANAEAAPSPAASVPAPAPQHHAPQRQGSQQSGQGKKQGKRFFQKSPGNGGQGNGFNGNGFGRPSPGNQNGNGNGGPRRKNKGRRQQTFVGPMDHSYRGGANGNVADPVTHSSNGDFRGMPHSGFYSEVDYYQPVVIREDAPTRIYCFIEDLFLAAKIQEVSRKLGIKVAFLKPDKEVVTKLVESDEENRPALIMVDLNNVNAKPLTLIPKIKAKLKRGTSIIGFLAQIQGELKSKAIEAGCDTVMPRATFSQNLPNLLRRYGSPEEEHQGEIESLQA